MTVNMENKGNGKKLSYTELENAAKQIAAQLDAVIKENRNLKMTLNRVSVQNAYVELDLMIKLLPYKDMFHKEFMDSVVAQIENDITAINTPEDNTEKDNTESKEDSKDKKEE
jgi:hypothetical protein